LKDTKRSQAYQQKDEISICCENTRNDYRIFKVQDAEAAVPGAKHSADPLLFKGIPYHGPIIPSQNENFTTRERQMRKRRILQPLEGQAIRSSLPGRQQDTGG
jgi:hypothetical protein